MTDSEIAAARAAKKKTSRITVKTKWMSIDAEVDDDTAQTLATILVNALLEKSNEKQAQSSPEEIEQAVAKWSADMVEINKTVKP